MVSQTLLESIKTIFLELGRDPPSGPGCGVQQEIEHAYNQVNKSGDI